MKRPLVPALCVASLLAAGPLWIAKSSTARAQGPHSASSGMDDDSMGAACPMCGMRMGHGMGMEHGMGMMFRPLADAKTVVKATNTNDGVTITISNPDKTQALQLQRLAQIMVLRHEMMKTSMQQHPGAAPPARTK